ncbi:ATP-binding protein [Oscillatoria salina]|uniref:ATP-binding protein n=1 Tax=Oscillatoria salina TaxID=331517 RepID=UPI0013BD50D4|nr:anti-sigma regulatory factor [Oscillatoria salina IIICB1]NET88382.1 anti-sigma regulatory factor [Kamptonema sp. SIO1D9]
MIAISLHRTQGNWGKMSFASTLYLCPVLDLLLAKVPPEWQPEVRLGLQEALVNAAKHGNQLDPSKTVVVEFSVTNDLYSWVISDQGAGFQPHCKCSDSPEELLPEEESESGRGFCILHQIFDQVHWNNQGTKLRLSKQVKSSKRRQPLLS